MTGETPKTELAHGVRVVARLASSDGTSAGYELEVTLPGAVFLGRAEFSGDGELALAWSGPAPLGAVEAMVRALLRSGWHRRRAGEPWPRRLSRWRPDPTTEPDPE
jgi:hypothetical protein